MGRFFSPRCIIFIMKPTKERILDYLRKIKSELREDGIL